MEKKEGTSTNELDRVEQNIPEEIKGFMQTWSENITEIDLSHQSINVFEESTQFPSNLATLNLAHNRLVHIPQAVLDHDKLKHLDLSHNEIMFFDDVPAFCHTIEHINLSNNKLKGPPYFVWSENPKKLVYLNLSNNTNITESLDASYLEELLQCNSLVTHLVVHNCRLGKYESLIGTFPRAKQLEIGGEEFSFFTANLMEDAPGPGLTKCCDIERLILCRTKIFNVNANIAVFKYLVEINLSDNKIRGLPEEFCSLEKLEICDLSLNYIMYLPENIGKLQELQCLYIAHNELCLLTEEVISLSKLNTVDVYNNNLYEVPDTFWKIAHIDAAQNFLVEPEVADYVKKKTELRKHIKALERTDGNKVELERPETEQSPDTTDDESFRRHIMKSVENQACEEVVQSSSEDWDSDRYWVPHGLCPPKKPLPSQASWLFFIKKRINEGRFCPIDLHTVPVYEWVMYQRRCNPTTQYESEGQFDDVTEDES